MWQCQYFSGKWIKNVSAGGRGQFEKSKEPRLKPLILLSTVNFSAILVKSAVWIRID